MSEVSQLVVELASAGIKSIYGGKGELPVADLYIDCRGIANPCYETKIGAMSGDAEVVQEWVASHTNVATYKALLDESISRLPIRRQGQDPYHKPFKVLCFCAHGVHRSKAMKHILATYLKQNGVSVVVK